MTPPFQPELLLTHAGALRSMARALLHDDHAAEDVVQETWLRAWSAPPRGEGSLGGWLRRVAEGFALQRRRAEGRRARRERDYAAERAEAVDSDQRSVVLRVVMEAVLALDEPYRETVLLRWFEGLPPRAIAGRLNVRVATIDSRLQRAHERLRVKLERELGDGTRRWRGLVALVLGAPDPTHWLPTLAYPLAGVAVSLKLTSAVLALVVGVCLWVSWERADPQPAESVGLGAAPSGERDLPALADGAAVAARELATSAAATATAIPTAEPAHAARSATLEPGPYPFALRIEVVDSAEFALHGAEVFLGPNSCSAVSFGETGWDGVLEREWRGFEPKFEGVLFVRIDGVQSSLRRVTLTSGLRSSLRFQMDPTAQELFRAVRLALRFEAVLMPTIADEFVIDAAGNGTFVDSSLARVLAASRLAPTAEDDRVSAADSATAAEDSRVSASDASASVLLALTEREVVGQHFQPEPAIPAAAPSSDQPLPRATVRGVVRDEHGRPITHLVVAGRTPDRWNTGVLCDEDGAFVFKEVPPGRMEVCVGGGERVLVREVFELAPGESRFLELRASLRATRHIRVRDRDSNPVGEWIVEARGFAPEFELLGCCMTDAEGTAVLGLSADVPVQYFARPRGGQATAAMLVSPSSRPDGAAAPWEFVVDTRRGAITFEVDGPLCELVEARAWRADSGQGVIFEREIVEHDAVVDVVIGSGALLVGSWHVEVRTAGRAWTEIGVLDVTPGEALDLGVVHLDPPASAFFETGEPSGERALCSLRARVDGALVIWPEQELEFPARLMTFGGIPIEFLTRPLDHADRAATLPLRDPLWLQAGVEQRIAVTPPR